MLLRFVHSPVVFYISVEVNYCCKYNELATL
ncbi:MAG: hypothetical protein HW390_2139 [Candidatus Brocadiaceae bacterium]|nr:hypothetical protein [Candidatus Brocadiaceae bacterium]